MLEELLNEGWKSELCIVLVFCIPRAWKLLELSMLKVLMVFLRSISESNSGLRARLSLLSAKILSLDLIFFFFFFLGFLVRFSSSC